MTRIVLVEKYNDRARMMRLVYEIKYCNIAQDRIGVRRFCDVLYKRSKRTGIELDRKITRHLDDMEIVNLSGT